MPILEQPSSPRDASFRRRAGAALGVVSLFAAVAATGTVRQPELPVARTLTIEPLAIPVFPASETTGKEVYWHETRYERGDTFAALLSRLGVNHADIAHLVKRHGGSKSFRSLRPGMLVQAQSTHEGALLGLRFTAGRESVLGFERDGDEFKAIDEAADLASRLVFKSGEVRSSLFAAADDAELPDSVTMQLADIFSGDVDFHRDLKRGDRFSVVYEVLYHEGRPLRTGRVLAAEFVNDRKVHRAFWFNDEEGKTGYYSADGKNLRKAFLRSPLEFSRVTSGFGMREHPIFHETRAHRGVDYSAPAGTKVRAAADGIVEFAGSQNGYGNVVILKHRAGITTVYAHLSGFEAVQGARVGQGDLIGYVGSTGWATGPHLHYEFRVNNEHRNPLTIAMPAAEAVAPQHMAAFRSATEVLTGHLGLLATVRLAALD